MKRQSTLHEFFLEDNLSNSDYEIEFLDSALGENVPPVKKRGRPKAPLKWTRVVEITANSFDVLQEFNLEEDA